jgi:uncharacterized protein with HEPN domain
MDGKSKADFLEYFQINDVVTRELAIVGEASHLISDEFKVLHPEFPWKDMKNVRNHVIHNYDGVDLYIVFNIVTDKLPRLKEKLEYLKLPSIRKPVLMPKKQSRNSRGRSI